ncbi:MAG: RCC1 domain-containing protein [Kofleriaceae bacterium]
MTLPFSLRSIAAALPGLLVMAACGDPAAYVCSRDDQCIDNGIAGTCRAGVCSYTSETCGALGATCCATGTACTSGSCIDGSCQSCILDVAFGRRFGCVLKIDGTIWCAGENEWGQLGSGSAGPDRPTHEPVKTLVDNTVIDDAVQLGLGRNHGCAIRSDASVWCWGANVVGQLGNGTTSMSQPAAVQVLVGGTPLLGATEIRSGNAHSCAITSASDVYCWGQNAVGQLGDGLVADRNQAALVLASPMGAAFTGARSLAIGSDTNCVHRGIDEIWCWGDNDHGQFRDGLLNTHPNPVLVGNAPAFGLGHGHICMVRESAIECTGATSHGCIANGERGFGDNALTPTVMKDATGGDFAGVASLAFAGGGGGCAMMDDSSVQCWGDSLYGQAGPSPGSPFPTAIMAADGKPLVGVDRLVAAYPHVCAHTPAGDWLCWGRNSEGDFGDGSFSNRRIPAPLDVSCP